jgi:hypothetical protein
MVVDRSLIFRCLGFCIILYKGSSSMGGSSLKLVINSSSNNNGANCCIYISSDVGFCMPYSY